MAYAEDVNVTVNVGPVEIGLNDQIVVSMRPVGYTTGNIDLYGNYVTPYLTYEVTSLVPMATTNAYSATTDAAWYCCATNGDIRQSFTVLAGQELAKAEIFVGDGEVDTDGYYADVDIYKGDYGSGTLVQTVAVPAASLVDCDWLVVTLDVPQNAGTYYVELSSDEGYNLYLNGLLFSDTTYSDGRAGAGSQLLGSAQDFAVKLTTEDVYQPTKAYTVSPYADWYCCSTYGSIKQSFVVPAGKMFTKVEILVGDCGRSDAGWYAAMYLFDGDYFAQDVVQGISVPAANVVDGGWLSLTLDTPQPTGTYYIALWSNQNYNNYLNGLRYTGSGYSNGLRQLVERSWVQRTISP